MTTLLTDTQAWETARSAALDRDGHRCTVARFLGGRCHDVLDVHYLLPVSEGGDEYDVDNLITACHRHHPMVEALRRGILRRRHDRWMPCPHPPGTHRYPHAREACERLLNRRRRRALTPA